MESVSLSDTSSFVKLEIHFITSSRDKWTEVYEALKCHGLIDRIRLIWCPHDLIEPQSARHEEVAEKKCRAAEALMIQLHGDRAIGTLVMVEDTSLSFHALNGMPGPYIRWFLSAMGVQDLPRLLADYSDKSATAITCFALKEVCCGDEQVRVIKGQKKGTIVSPPRGSSNFGWDSIFQPRKHSLTFAEMDLSTKNSISHRGKAISSLIEQLEVLLSQSETDT